MKWIRGPQPHKIQSIMKQFSSQQKILESTWRPLAGQLATSSQIREAIVDLNQELRLKSEAETRMDYLLDTDAAKGHMSTGIHGSRGHKLIKKDLDPQAESMPPLQFDGLPKDLGSDKDHSPAGDVVASLPANDAEPALSTP